MGDTVIKLSRTYEALGKTFDQLTLREPTGADYWHVGPIAEWQPVGDGQAQITYHDKVGEYARRLIQAPDGVSSEAALAVLSLPDTLLVAGGVRGFFSAAVKSAEPATS